MGEEMAVDHIRTGRPAGDAFHRRGATGFGRCRAAIRRAAGVIVVAAAVCALMAGLARAADPAEGIQGAPGPAQGTNPAKAAPAVTCNRPTPPRAPGGAPVSVVLNAATAWQPRNGEVLVAVKGEAKDFADLAYKACFGWNAHEASDYFSEANLKGIAWREGFVTIRPSDQPGLMNLGITVPVLESAPGRGILPWSGDTRSSGLGLVPVADMRLIAYGDDGTLFDEVRPVGITSVSLAVAVVVLVLVVAVATTTLHSLATGIAPFSAVFTGNGLNVRSALSLAGAAASPGWILDLIKTPDGRASLSAFQVLLWMMVVAMSAVYVMALSGTLINVTAGTLTLLGIAGAAGLVTPLADRTPGPARTSANAAIGAGAAPPGQQGSATGDARGPRTPRWSDLVIDPASKAPDVTRAQMLLFTVVGAGFVLLQVLNYYVIPDIPSGYLTLIGISNGVYVGRKFTA